MPEYECLRFIASECVPFVLNDLNLIADASLRDLLARYADADRTQYLEEEFRRLNLVSAPDLSITSRGKACHAAVDIIEGGSIVDSIDRLHEIEPSSKRITVVPNSMTDLFLSLVRRLDSIRRIWICSPWISLSRDRLRDFQIGIERAKRETGFPPEITIVTRPVQDQPLGHTNDTLAFLRRTNAVMKYSSSLHSKLYILETAGSVPWRQAFVGSENFTKQRYQEIGIRVDNDNQLIDDLVRYVLALT